MRAELKAQRTRSWGEVTLGDLARRIAADHGLQARVGSALRGIAIPHLDQTEESDLNLLTRLAGDHDTVAKQSGKYLLLVPRGEVASATGKPTPAIDVRPEDASRWRLTLADREAYSPAEASWHDAETGERKTETAGSGEPKWTIRRAYASASVAAEAARSKLVQLARGTALLAVDLSPCNPVAAAEAELRMAGFRDDVDGSSTCQRVVHKLDRGAFNGRFRHRVDVMQLYNM
ncbi:MAG: contractile injection system protein, VgrG/Pvc8 family [Bryobacterales bacterium]|nr:contractile injection system protein, VgrG/Pvc8 family [Bryobacterales bacterium]